MRRKKLGISFYQQPAEQLAQALVGKILVHRHGGKSYRARIVETEAYCGPEDLASHSSKGLTARTRVMFGPAGRAYVYFIYGMYDMFNIVAGTTGEAHAVLIRAAEPLGWEADLSGPGKLARAMKITRADNGLSLLGGKIFLEDWGGEKPTLVTTARIGVDYAGVWKDRLLRYFDGGSKAVSKLQRRARHGRTVRGTV